MRKAYLDVSLNAVSITKDISGNVVSFSFDDNSADEADGISLTIENRTKQWLNNWQPQTADFIEVTIITEDWTGSLLCGKFTVNKVSLSGRPLTVNISGVSMPVNTNFAETDRSKSWEEATISEIAGTIAGNNGITLEYRASYNPTINFLSQVETNDKKFLYELCIKYGLTMKLYSDKIIIYDIEEEKQVSSGTVLHESDMINWSCESSISETGFTSCTVNYTDTNGELLEYTYSGGDGKYEKNYKQVEQMDNLGQATRMAPSILKKLNMGETKFSGSVPGNVNILSGMSITIDGFGNYDGTYYIDKTTHSVGGGYKTDIQAHRL